MEKEIQELYDYLYQELMSCKLDEEAKIAHLCGAQGALEVLSDNIGFNLKRKNLKSTIDNLSDLAIRIIK